MNMILLKNNTETEPAPVPGGFERTTALIMLQKTIFNLWMGLFQTRKWP